MAATLSGASGSHSVFHPVPNLRCPSSWLACHCKEGKMPEHKYSPLGELPVPNGSKAPRAPLFLGLYSAGLAIVLVASFFAGRYSYVWEGARLRASGIELPTDIFFGDGECVHIPLHALMDVMLTSSKSDGGRQYWRGMHGLSTRSHDVSSPTAQSCQTSGRMSILGPLWPFPMVTLQESRRDSP